jgi:hypothetical protein
MTDCSDYIKYSELMEKVENDRKRLMPYPVVPNKGWLSCENEDFYIKHMPDCQLKKIIENTANKTRLFFYNGCRSQESFNASRLHDKALSEYRYRVDNDITITGDLL